MLFRNLTVDGDWTFGAGFSNFATLDAAIALNVRTRILSWVGDCFFDTGAGIDWINRLGSKNQRNLLDLDLRRAILRSYGVTGLIEFDTFLNGRVFSAQYTVNTIYGKEYQSTINLEI